MKNFTQGSIPKQLLIFSFPLILSNLVQAIYSTIDAIWVGRLISHSALAAVSTSMPVIFFSASLLIGISIATTILTGQAFGRQDRDQIKHIVSNSLIILVIITGILTALGMVFSVHILKLINAPSAIFHDTLVFFKISLAGFIFISINQWLICILNGLGDSKNPFLIQLVTILLNCALAPVCIKGWIPFIPSGVAGSAFATVISSMIGTLLSFAVFQRHPYLSKLGISLTLNGAIIRKIVLMGIPMSLQMIIVSTSALLIVSLVNTFGESVTAAFGIGFRIDNFAFMTIMAVSSAISSMTAQNIGAQNYARVNATARWGCTLSMAFGLFFIFSTQVGASALARLFTSDTKVIAETVHYFRIVSYSYVGLAMLFSFQGIARGAGDVISALVIVSVSMLIIRVPLCYFLATHTALGVRGLWIGVMSSVYIGGIAYAGYYKSGRWKRVKKNYSPMPHHSQERPAPKKQLLEIDHH